MLFLGRVIFLPTPNAAFIGLGVTRAKGIAHECCFHSTEMQLLNLITAFLIIFSYIYNRSCANVNCYRDSCCNCYEKAMNLFSMSVSPLLETYVTMCKIDSHREFAVWLGKLKQGLCINLEGWDGEADGREFQKGGNICIPMDDSF